MWNRDTLVPDSFGSKSYEYETQLITGWELILAFKLLHVPSVHPTVLNIQRVDGHCHFGAAASVFVQLRVL